MYVCRYVCMYKKKEREREKTSFSKKKNKTFLLFPKKKAKH